MKNKKIFLIIILAFSIILIFILTTYLILTENKRAAVTSNSSSISQFNLSTSSIIPASSSIDPYTGWKTYTNNQYQLSFKYPSRFVNYTDSSINNTAQQDLYGAEFVAFNDPKTITSPGAPWDVFSLSYYSNTNNYSLTDYIQKLVQTETNNCYQVNGSADSECKYNLTKKNMTINGNQAIYTDNWHGIVDWASPIHVFIKYPNSNAILNIEIAQSPTQKFTEIDKMINSVELFNTFQSQNYNFKFQYDPNIYGKVNSTSNPTSVFINNSPDCGKVQENITFSNSPIVIVIKPCEYDIGRDLNTINLTNFIATTMDGKELNFIAQGESDQPDSLLIYSNEFTNGNNSGLFISVGEFTGSEAKRTDLPKLEQDIKKLVVEMEYTL